MEQTELHGNGRIAFMEEFHHSFPSIDGEAFVGVSESIQRIETLGDSSQRFIAHFLPKQIGLLGSEQDQSFSSAEVGDIESDIQIGMGWMGKFSGAWRVGIQEGSHSLATFAIAFRKLDECLFAAGIVDVGLFNPCSIFWHECLMTFFTPVTLFCL